MPLTADETLQNRYRVTSLLGQGGMGAVYRAWDTRLNIPVALKEMTPQPGLDAVTLAQLRQQFKQEASILARLDHSHLVDVTDFFEEGGNAYLVMKFIEGESLANRIVREGALSEAEVAAWAGQLLDALDYCHNQGVLHRDIKPQNVIIRPDGRAVLVDFGLVKLWDPDDPRTKTAMRGMGTPEYAPPEQYETAAGHTAPASDIYSLGATLYHALTGQAPPTATLRMADPTQFAPIRELIPHVSPQMEAAISKAMELVRSQRWESAQQMVAALRGEPPARRPETAPKPDTPPPPIAPQRRPTKVIPDAQAAAAVSQPAVAHPAVPQPRGGISRRKFLYGALAVGGAVVGCGGAAVVGLLATGYGDQLFGPPAEEPVEPTARPRAKPTEKPREEEPTEKPRDEPTEAPAPAGPAAIRWFIGLGGGTDEGQVALEEEWVDTFNARQDEIELALEIVPPDDAYNKLRAQIASGDPPDVVGPVGVRGSSEFHGMWLNLDDYLGGYNYDMDDFNPSALATWWTPDQGLTGLPAIVWPSALYINLGLFEARGLELPPQDYGRGGWWTIEALAEFAVALTVDANGNDASSRSFDPERIEQFGYVTQWADARGMATLFGAGSFVDGGGNAHCPDHWREAFHWHYWGMWGGYFQPNGPYINDMLGGNAFGSGRVAMAHCHLWLTCCVPDIPWDYAIVPSRNGAHTAKLHTDAIGVLKDTPYPEAAVQATYAMTADPGLIEAWVGTTSLPARQSLWEASLAGFAERFPGVNWDTIVAGLDHIDVPNHESYIPNVVEANERAAGFSDLLMHTPDLNVDAAIEELLADLQELFDAA